MSQVSAVPVAGAPSVPTIPFGQLAPWALFFGLLGTLVLFFVSTDRVPSPSWPARPSTSGSTTDATSSATPATEPDSGPDPGLSPGSGPSSERSSAR